MAPRKRSSRCPYLPFYGDDFFGSQHVAAMEPAAHGVYLKLLWFAWRDGSIPDDALKLARMVGLAADQFEPLWEQVCDCWVSRDGKLIQERLEEIRADQDEFRRRSSDAGRKAAIARWGCDGNAIASEPHSDRIGTALRFDAPQPQPQVQGSTPPTPPGHPPSPRGELRSDGGEGEGSGGGNGWHAYHALWELGIRSRSKTRPAAIMAMLRKFHDEGGDDPSLKKLIRRAKACSTGEPAALLSKWLDKGEWQKELQKR